jgi:radical SAM protein with 4Fe4S-binding SPASM domain
MLTRMLTRERLKAVYGAIFSLKTPGLEIVTGDPVASQLSEEMPENADGSFPEGGCAAGVSGLTLLPDGTITPCRRMGIPVGNILKDSLREIWATSDVLNALRDKKAYKGKCGTCKRWSTCRGCRAIAYAYSVSQGRNDFLEEDPQCFIE